MYNLGGSENTQSLDQVLQILKYLADILNFF